MKRQTKVLSATAALVLASAGAVSAAGGAAASPAVPRLTHLRAMYDVGVHTSVHEMKTSVAASVPRFTGSVTDGTSTFHYSLVGKNPAVHVTNAMTTVKTVIVPLKIVLPNGDTFDPTVASACDATSALSRTLASPIFQTSSYSFNGVAVGSGQYISEFQRAEFWKYAQPGATNPTYGLKLTPSSVPAVTVNVPSSAAAEGSAACGTLGAVEINWLDGYLQNTLFPQLKASLTPGVFPLFLVHDVVEYITTTSNCCVLGYHSAFNNPSFANAVQTYGVSIYDDTQDFSGTSDVSALSHEVGEWANDPLGNNPTKPWGHIGQVSGCQSNLEVGDPLSGTIFAQTTSGHAYSLQELAFFSWFYHQSPSLGVGGKYSNLGTFTTPAAACS